MWNAVVVVVLAWWSLFWHLVETQELHHGNLHVHDHGVYVVAVAALQIADNFVKVRPSYRLPSLATRAS